MNLKSPSKIALIPYPRFLKSNPGIPQILGLVADPCIQIIGWRSENLYRYTSYFEKSGKIRALDFKQYCDTGITDNDAKAFNSSMVVGLTGIIPGPWEVKNIRYSSVSVKTAKAASTFMRAPGVLCSAYFMEHIFETAASKLNIDQISIRQQNLTSPGYKDLFGLTQDGDRVVKNFDQVKNEVMFSEQVAKVEKFNAENEYKKQGVSITPFKYRWSNDFVYGGITICIGKFDGTVWARIYICIFLLL